ncbi:hypothetical protein ACLFKX_05595 [Enterobacter hormaechei]
MVSETKTTEAPALRRALKARHLTMIAIGGCIGTGLFVASGATISAAGPGGALFSYILIGLMVYFLMTAWVNWRHTCRCLVPFRPTAYKYWLRKASASRWAGTNWYNWAVTIAVDLVAAQLVMTWWFPDTRRLDLERPVPGGHLPAELHLRARLWRSGILVLFD